MPGNLHHLIENYRFQQKLVPFSEEELIGRNMAPKLRLGRRAPDINPVGAMSARSLEHSKGSECDGGREHPSSGPCSLLS